MEPTRPRIGLNGRFLVAQRTGVQRSAYRLFRSLTTMGQGFQFVLFTSPEECRSPDWQLPNVSTVPCNVTPTHIFQNHLWEQFSLPQLAHGHKIDLLHSPANLAPVFYRGKSIVNIHDVCFLVEPSWFSWSFRMIYSNLVPRIARNASVVLTNSNNSKNDILEYLGADVRKVRFSYWAVEPLFFQHGLDYSQRDDQILFVGSLEPRKNLSGLIQAFNLFRERNPGLATRLSVVGCENPLFAQTNYELGDFGDDITFVGYIDDLALAKLYGRSKALVYPSFYEGFGIPPLEAMASGTPVITSWNSSLPEVVGDAALLVNPADPEEIAQKIEAILNNPAFAQELVDRGNAKVREFRWEKIASHVLGIYEELLGLPPGSALGTPQIGK